jgi:hypothetical protein
MSMAEAIIDSNDQGEIQEAWDFAEEALSINKGGNYVDDPSKNPAEVGCGDCAG